MPTIYYTEEEYRALDDANVALTASISHLRAQLAESSYPSEALLDLEKHAITSLWKELGVGNQIQAMSKIKELMAESAAKTTNPVVQWQPYSQEMSSSLYNGREYWLAIKNGGVINATKDWKSVKKTVGNVVIHGFTINNEWLDNEFTHVMEMQYPVSPFS